MKPIPSFHSQRGATLVVGLIMLLLITVMVTSAFTQSNSNLKSVGNMQFRNESVAAANSAIEQVLGTDFMTNPVPQEIAVDINKDNTDDYTVSLAAATCVRSVLVQAPTPPGKGSSAVIDLPLALAIYNTVWNLDATVTDMTSGTKVQVHQGIRKQRDTACPP